MPQPQSASASAPPLLPPPSPSSPGLPLIPGTPLPDQDSTDAIPASDPRSYGLALRSIQDSDIQRCRHIASNQPPFAPGVMSRLMRELQDNAKDPVPYVSFAPISGGDLQLGSPYEGGIFYIKLDFEGAYPMVPPKCVFLTKVLHPNVSPRGEICMDLLQEGWSPGFKIQSLLISICSLLTDPYFPELFLPELEEIYTSDRESYGANIREYTWKWATGIPPEPSVFEEARKSGLDLTWEDYADDSDEIEG